MASVPEFPQPCVTCGGRDVEAFGTGHGTTWYCTRCGAVRRYPDLPPLPADHPRPCRWCNCRTARRTVPTPGGPAGRCGVCFAAAQEVNRRELARLAAAFGLRVTRERHRGHRRDNPTWGDRHARAVA
jgi:hypothetical protein